MNNIIPAPYAAGSFDCLPPYDSICDKDVYYTVEGIRTLDEIKKSGGNVVTKVLKPVNLQDTSEGEKILKDLDDLGGAVVTLIAQGGSMIDIPSTHFKSFPLVDGVKYERLCLYVDLGAVPPTLKDGINELKETLREYVLQSVGIKDSVVDVGTIPLRGYVEKERADLFELERQQNITNSSSLIVRNKELEEQHKKDKAYIADLERRLLEK